jgi:hypothetical protein
LTSISPTVQGSDLLTIDVERFNFDVLKSNDWDFYRQTIILVELLGTVGFDVARYEITQSLHKQGYTHR